LRRGDSKPAVARTTVVSGEFLTVLLCADHAGQANTLNSIGLRIVARCGTCVGKECG
jgi:hypothetical protein